MAERVFPESGGAPPTGGGVSDYAMVLDVMGTLADLQSEEACINNIMDLFMGVCGPRWAAYLPWRGDVPGELQVRAGVPIDRARMKDRMSGFHEDYAWTDSGEGFTLSITHKGEKIGILELDHLALPVQKSHYLNMALSVRDVLGLSVANARIYHDLQRTQESLREEKERAESYLEELERHKEGLETLVSERTQALTDANRELSREMARGSAMQEEIQEQHAFLLNVLDSLSHPFYIVDVDTFKVTMANKSSGFSHPDNDSYCFLFNYGVKKGTCCDEKRRRNRVRAVRDTRAPVRVEHVVEDLEGNEQIWEINGFPVFSRAGDVRQVIEYAIEITERKKFESDLREAKLAAEEGSRAKSAFLALISHEIRTPLNAILGMSDLLGETQLDREQAHYLEISTRAGESLLALVNDVLDLSKIEAGRMTLESAPFDLHALAQDVVTLLGGLAREKNIRFSCAIDSGVPVWVEGDATRLRQVLVNLLNNAIKFTIDGDVDLSVAPGEGEGFVLFLVRDSGVGIPREKLETIFQPFVQADASTTREFGGAGLGLNICQKLIQQMGGEIRVESRVGAGSLFTARARLPRVDDPTLKAVSAPLSAGEGAKTAAQVKALSILVVDDARENQLVIKAFLKRTPHRLTLIDNGAKALEQVKVETYDLVLMDMLMPVMDGYEATRRIRAWEAEGGVRSRLPIIALTAQALKEDQDRSLEAGCDAHLTKPFTKAQLLTLVNDFISSGE